MSNSPGTRSSALRRVLIFMDLLYLVALGFSVVPAIFSPMLAAGGNNWVVYIQVYSLMTFPFVLIFSILVPWIFYALNMARTAKVLLLFPFINGVLILLCVIIPEWLA